MPSSKRKVRELAMQVLFLWDAHGEKDRAMASQAVHDGVDDPAVRERAVDVAAAAWDARDVADQWVLRLAPQWPTRRQPGVDRSILRLAVWELTSADTPPKVVLDEAIELAKQFSTEHSPAFVNGVLDAVLKENRALTEGASGEATSQSSDEVAMEIVKESGEVSSDGAADEAGGAVPP